MKKNLLFLVSVIFIAFSAISASAMEATVVSTTGKTELQQPNGDWVQLKTGDKLEKGSVIQTGFKSELVLQIKGTKVTVSPLSRLTIEQVAEKDTKDETRLYIDSGALKADVQKSENRRVGFTVRSSVATASVRGTILSVKNRFGRTGINTQQGIVAVWKSNQQGAQISTDEEDAAPAAPASIGNSATDVSDSAPDSAFTVVKGQRVTIGSSGSVDSVITNAKKDSYGLVAIEKSAAATENVSLGTTAASDGTASQLTESSETVLKGTGFIQANVAWY